MDSITFDIYNQVGEKIGTHSANPNVFGVEAKPSVIHAAYIRQLANWRAGTAKTKTRAEVRGGGRKPWKQKGTGRARAGTTRSPIWRHGGVIFGPTGEQNYSTRMPRKQRQKALLGSLSLKAKDGKIMVLDKYSAKAVKTKLFADVLKKLPVGRDTLLVLGRHNKLVERSTRNLPQVKTILARYLNIADILKFQTVLFLKDGLVKTEKVWGKSGPEEVNDKS